VSEARLQQIRTAAANLFCRQGYHGVSLRELAKEAGCSLSVIYHYFENKESLFKEAVFREFSRLIDQMYLTGRPNESFEDLFVRSVMLRGELPDSEKMIYRLFLRVRLGFDGTEDLQQLMARWDDEQFSRMLQSHNLASGEPVPRQTQRILRALFRDLTQREILFGESYRESWLRDDLALIFSGQWSE
jgi:AcrR family transcriptional regulator